MTAAWTIFVDSFRLLQARKLFWISLGISLLVAVLYASIGFNERGITFLFGWQELENPVLVKGSPEAEAFYMSLFTDYIVGFWLAFFSIFLALLSTASIFPDFMAEGSIGISLSKPVSRLQLFLLKYLGCMFFVALQMTLFTLVVFLAFGLRFGQWNFTVFWAVPIITFVFSLIHCCTVLVGVWTRSTLFALLGGMLLWGCTLLAQWSEDVLYKMAYTMPDLGVGMDWKTGEMRQGAAPPEPAMVKAHRIAEGVLWPLPKTRESTLYLRRMIRVGDGARLTEANLGFGATTEETGRKAFKKTFERHSTWYVLGTSALFEGVVLAGAAWIFCRRDY